MMKKRDTKRIKVGEKRKVKGINNNNNIKKKKKFMKTNNKLGSNQVGKWCGQCKKKHFGDYVICFKCKKLENISTNCHAKGRFCFDCGEEGNMKAECPKPKKVIPRILPPKPKGWSYQMTLNKAKEKPTLLQTITLRLSTPNLVEVAGGRNIPISNMLEAVTVNLDGNGFRRELLPFELSEFDIILSMDCLGANLADILCGRKMVHVNPLGKNPFIIYRDRIRVKSGIIPMIKAKRCLSKGCSAFLAYIIDTKKEKREMADILVVRNFPEVFPDELLGLPLERQVELRIDLFPCMTPIVKATYRLALIEMKELMTQLQEFLDGTIRICIDYWELNKATIKNKYPLHR
ncbi:uncharacterized protein LOC128129035 [Lactuca sativa]|uniref:uncharacterized protein LOC128129035 n=1 Tax=Lactuca sativa TaxID=4236 RepID=UPI0022AEA1CC|nr:uncharacterized protein LOC128129035 [Lactuca sativa]